MKALVVRQPWASMIAMGVKRVEVRSRRTNYRGDLLIVAGKAGADHPGLPRGVAVAVVRIADCRPFEPADANTSGCQWRPGLWAWVLADIRPIYPVPVRGMPGIFKTDRVMFA